jgi:p-hydroxybenzoate 3-monooxygenase
MRTQVAIVGAGPAGLVLGQLLHAAGVEAVVLEARDRAYVERRVRAGVLEQATVDLLAECGVDARLRREGLVHHGVELRFGGVGHRIDLSGLTGGRAITVYGQQEVVKDLIAARLAFGGPLHFEVSDVRVEGIEGEHPAVRYVHEGAEQVLEADAVAGCDGFHGVCRDAIPAGALRSYEREYPFAWLGILVDEPPPSDELIYCLHERGFALVSLRSPEVTRMYLQVAPDEDLDAWPDERIWDELNQRLATEDGWHADPGPIFERGITPMRSFVTEPMRHGRLFLAGDAAHIVPPTGAKGLNLAVADVRVLAHALERFCASGDESLLDAYSDTCLRRVWQVQQFSWQMTSMLHRFPGDDAFQMRLQRSQLDSLVASPAASAALAEQYVGLPHPTRPADGA